MDDKIIVTNRGALKAKYKNAGFAKVAKSHQKPDRFRQKARAQNERRLSGRYDRNEEAESKSRQRPDEFRARTRKPLTRFFGDQSGILDDPWRARRGAAPGHDEPDVRPACRSGQIRLG